MDVAGFILFLARRFSLSERFKHCVQRLAQSALACFKAGVVALLVDVVLQTGTHIPQTGRLRYLSLYFAIIATILSFLFEGTFSNTNSLPV